MKSNTQCTVAARLNTSDLPPFLYSTSFQFSFHCCSCRNTESCAALLVPQLARRIEEKRCPPGPAVFRPEYRARYPLSADFARSWRPWSAAKSSTTQAPSHHQSIPSRHCGAAEQTPNSQPSTVINTAPSPHGSHGSHGSHAVSPSLVLRRRAVRPRTCTRSVHNGTRSETVRAAAARCPTLGKSTGRVCHEQAGRGATRCTSFASAPDLNTRPTSRAPRDSRPASKSPAVFSFAASWSPPPAQPDRMPAFDHTAPLTVPDP